MCRSLFLLYEVDGCGRNMMKIILFANTDWYLFNFRRALADAIIADGHRLILVSPAGNYSDRLLQEGYDWRELNFDGQSKSLVRQYRLFRRINRLYRRERPDIVHHFTIKCVLFGGLAARLNGINTVQAVTGLGHVFTEDSLSMRMIRQAVKILYRFVCRHRRAVVIFQNSEDRQIFVKEGLVAEDRAFLIRGSGADCNRYRPSAHPRPSGACRLLFASRLLKEKGVWELVDAFKQMVAEKYDVELLLAGEIYCGNPSSLTERDVRKIDAISGVEVLGHVDDMVELFHRSDIVVLPSYKEGTPRVLLEAGACGKPLVATDIAGCRGVVVPGENGELVPAGDVAALKNALVKLLDEEVRRRYGRRSREIIEKHFSEKTVIKKTLKVYELYACSD